MDESDLEPRRKPAQPKDLTLLGVAELEAYIAELEAEIARVRVEITAKLGQRRGAEALFKRWRRPRRGGSIAPAPVPFAPAKSAAIGSTQLPAR
jgi:uncharacterized small protein (DUF1192 family)